MVSLKRSQIRVINEVFGMKSGYVLDFSNRTIAEFFEDELNVEIYDDKYATQGNSKACRLRSFIEQSPPSLVAQALSKLFEYKKERSVYENPFEFEADSTAEDSQYKVDEARLNKLLGEIDIGTGFVADKELQESIDVINFDTVSRDLSRAREAARSDPEDAITSACSTLESVFRSILIELNQPLPSKKDIQGLYNALKAHLALDAGRDNIPDLIKNDVLMVLSGLQSAVQGIGALRTHAGDAHGREKGYKRIDPRIAVLGINAANTLAFFVIETWQQKYPRKVIKKHEL